MTDTPKKTLTLKRSTTGSTDSTATPATAPTTVTRTGKRVIRREDLPTAATRPPRPSKPANQGKPTHGKPTKPTKGKKKPAKKLATKKPTISPSDLKARELNDRLNGFPVWIHFKPLAIGIDKDVYRLVNAEHFPGASKKVVQKVLRMHTHHGRYLQAILQGGGRYHLDGTEEGEVNEQQRQLAADMIQRREQVPIPN